MMVFLQEIDVGLPCAQGMEGCVSFGAVDAMCDDTFDASMLPE